MTGILKYKNHLLPGGQFRNPFDSRIFAELKKPGNGLKSQQVLGKRFMSSFNHQHPGEHYDNLELPSISSGGGSLIPRKRIKEQVKELDSLQKYDLTIFTAVVSTARSEMAPRSQSRSGRKRKVCQNQRLLSFIDGYGKETRIRSMVK